MPDLHRKVILNASLPAQFRRIRIELAREPDHPDGDSSFAYVIVAPLDSNGRIDADVWRKHREACRFARLRPEEADRRGHLVHRPNNGWALHYESLANLPDEIGVHFADEQFIAGEYVSIRGAGETHTYRVTSVSHL